MFLICTLALDRAYLWGQRQDPPCHRRARVKALEWIRKSGKTWDREFFFFFFCYFCLSLRVACTRTHSVSGSWAESERQRLYPPAICWLISPQPKVWCSRTCWERGIFFPIFFLFIYYFFDAVSSPSQKKREDWEGWRRFLRELVFRLQPFKQTQMLDSSSTCDLWHHTIKRDVVKGNKEKGGVQCVLNVLISLQHDGKTLQSL